MSQHYSDPKRRKLFYALPNVETFKVDKSTPKEECPGEFYAQEDPTLVHVHGKDCYGWYYWFCFPGCLPDSDPIGPFSRERDAIRNFREREEA